MTDYSDRHLIDVLVSKVASWIDKDGETIISGEITLTLNSAVSPDLAGPHIKVYIGIPIDADLSLKEAESRLLDATNVLLGRFLHEPRENVLDVYERRRDSRQDPDPFADLQKELPSATGKGDAVG